MKIKSKSIDGINEITYDTETGATTTTLLHNVKNQIGFKISESDLTTGKVVINNIEITSVEDWEKVINSLKQLQQENQKYKEALSKLNEMNADNYNKYCEELKKNIELKKQLNELKEIEKDHQRLNGELREELKKCI